LKFIIIIIDTLALSLNIEKTGLDRRQAEVIAESIAGSINEHNKNLSTKKDVYFLGAVMVAGFGHIIST